MWLPDSTEYVRCDGISYPPEQRAVRDRGCWIIVAAWTVTDAALGLPQTAQIASCADIQQGV
jgi:hypothetical protein